MMATIGLDLSLTSTGVVVLDNGVVRKLVDGTYERAARPGAMTLSSKHRGVERLIDLSNQLGEAIGQFINMETAAWVFGFPLAVIEGYSMGSRSGQAFSIGEWGGVARVRLRQMGISYIVVPPSTLKKFTTGKGNAQKDEMRLHVYKKWGFEHKANDVVDAYALARFGEAYLAFKDGKDEVGGRLLTKIEFETVQKFIKDEGKKGKEEEAG